MAVSRKLVRVVSMAAICVSLSVVGGWFLVERSLNHLFQKTDLEPLETIVKASAAEVITVSRAEKPLVGNYAELYGKDPEKVRATAKISETWYNAITIADEVFKNEPTGEWVRRSDEIRSLKASKNDAWGHPFCLLRRDYAVAIVSAGPKAASSPVCSNISVSASELIQLPRGRMVETPSGALVLVMEKKS